LKLSFLVKALLIALFGLSVRFADLVIKTAPIFTGFKTTAAVWLFDLTAQDIAVVCEAPERGFSDH
tara:strand:- start:311 stop:508 length:198 start_codon:yes stop_codon:yes gene_type:complete